MFHFVTDKSHTKQGEGGLHWAATSSDKQIYHFCVFNCVLHKSRHSSGKFFFFFFLSHNASDIRESHLDFAFSFSVTMSADSSSEASRRECARLCGGLELDGTLFPGDPFALRFSWNAKIIFLKSSCVWCECATEQFAVQICWKMAAKTNFSGNCYASDYDSGNGHCTDHAFEQRPQISLSFLLHSLKLFLCVLHLVQHFFQSWNQVVQLHSTPLYFTEERTAQLAAQLACHVGQFYSAATFHVRHTILVFFCFIL